jgi:hypothetical protein
MSGRGTRRVRRHAAAILEADAQTMTFQAYLDNIKKKTGKTPEGFEKITKQKGLLEPA